MVVVIGGGGGSGGGRGGGGGVCMRFFIYSKCIHLYHVTGTTGYCKVIMYVYTCTSCLYVCITLLRTAILAFIGRTEMTGIRITITITMLLNISGA